MSFNSRVKAHNRDCRVLQRRSWKILGWASVIVLWVVGISAAMAGIHRNGNYRDAIFFTASIAAISAFCRRYGTCRIVLTRKFVIVVGLLGVHNIPHETVKEVIGDPHEGLSISTVHGDEINPFCFGGSLADVRFGTSQRAAEEIRAMLPGSPKSASSAPRIEKNILRRSLGADLFLAVAILAGVIGLILVALGIV